jgi:general secretion pathway protein E/type IV pilus assembly protein PilB
MTTELPTGLAALLKRSGLLTDTQIQRVLETARAAGMTIPQVVAREGYAREDDFLKAMSPVLHLPFVQLGAIEVDAAILEKLPTKAVFQYAVFPLEIKNNALEVATNEPFNPALVDALRLASGLRVRLALATSEDIANATKKFYGVGADTVERLIQDDRIEVPPQETLLKMDVSDMDQEASIVKFVNQIIWEAFEERATDIHLEPMESALRIRYRVDGVLHQTPLPAQLTRFQAAIISRIKVMANMDIAEKRLPQDGRIGLRIQGEDIDIRVSTMPTVYGESVSLRLLMRGKEFIGFSDLGMRPADVQTMRRLIERPNGIILVTGPTGSGKSTSLYAYLHEINTIDQRIITVEDPIEYEMGGINQINVKPEIGLTFATALRHILRQDPDVIMIGEIRDFETAEIAIRASLTGHLVFSTLHTNDACGAITRLLDMGVEPFLVASSLEAVVAQRLVRRLCPACRRPATPDRAFLESIGFPVAALAEGRAIYDAAGCEKCRATGYRGRTGIYEVLAITEAIEPRIIERTSSHAIKQIATEQGMQTLRDDGWMKVLDGITTLEEVLRVTEETE